MLNNLGTQNKHAALLHKSPASLSSARLAQSAERKALNLVVVGSSPTVGVHTAFVAKTSLPEVD